VSLLVNKKLAIPIKEVAHISLNISPCLKMSSGFAWALGNVELSLQPNSLSRPPYLHYWALDSGKWRLRKIPDEKFQQTSCCGRHSSRNRADEAACLRYDGIVEHILMEGETIESICEHYGCSLHSIIQCNGGCGVTLALPSYLRIPVKIGFPVSKLQSHEKNVIVQRFVLETNSSHDEAVEFLAAQSYDFVKAMNLWDQTHSWEQRYLDSLKQVAPIYVTSYSRLASNDVAENSVGSALPPPPLGYDWKALPNGEWELTMLSGNDSFAEDADEREGSTFPNMSSYFLHRIKPSDTLEGLCLRYRVTQRAVMKLNHLSTKKIQFLKEIRIPLRSGEPSPVMEDETETESNAERDLIQNFAQDTSATLREAKYYLQLSHYDYQEALREWREDEEWSQKNELGNEMLLAGVGIQSSQQRPLALEISY
jgi:hypothetical protein